MTLKRIACLVLLLAVAAAFLSLAGFASAEEGLSIDGWAPVADAGGEAIDDYAEALDAGIAEPVDDAVSAMDGVDLGGEDDAQIDAAEAAGDMSEAAGSPLDDDIIAGYIADLSNRIAGTSDRLEAASHFTDGVVHSVDITQNGLTVTVRGSVAAPYCFNGLFVDDKVVAYVTGNDVDQTINISSLDTGYHTVWLAVIHPSDASKLVDAVFRQFVEVNKISDTPSYGGEFVVYDTYFDIYPFASMFSSSVYLEYSADDGATWNRTDIMKANAIQLAIQQSYRIEGLQPNTVYRNRLRCGEYITYSKEMLGDGNAYFFGGPPLETTTIRTGAAYAPWIKSVAIKAVKVKHRRVKHYGYYTGVYLYTEKYYTCKLRVTVKLKQKPGTNGMWITLNDLLGQRVFVSGNKKKYTATFTPYPNYFAKNPRGHYRYSVTIQSGQDVNWGGFSPAATRTRKLR